jgi:hypothetical protein
MKYSLLLLLAVDPFSVVYAATAASLPTLQALLELTFGIAFGTVSDCP